MAIAVPGCSSSFAGLRHLLDIHFTYLVSVSVNKLYPMLSFKFETGLNILSTNIAAISLVSVFVLKIAYYYFG